MLKTFTRLVLDIGTCAAEAPCYHACDPVVGVEKAIDKQGRKFLAKVAQSGGNPAPHRQRLCARDMKRLIISNVCPPPPSVPSTTMSPDLIASPSIDSSLNTGI